MEIYIVNTREMRQNVEERDVCMFTPLMTSLMTTVMTVQLT